MSFSNLPDCVILYRCMGITVLVGGWAERMAQSRGLSFYRRKKKINASLVREIFSWIFGIAAAVFIAAVVNYFFGMIINVVGNSMEPTLYNGQEILINRFSYLLSVPDEGDVVAFLPNGNANSHYYVKRVVAGPGDTVLIQKGTLYVNGQESIWQMEKILDAGTAENQLTLGNGEYFCIGDSPNNSEDSRSANVGMVKEEDMVGKVWFRLSCEESGMGLVK